MEIEGEKKIEPASKEEIASLQEQLDSLKSENEDLKNQPANMNWRATRKTIDNLKKVILDSGLEVDEEGKLKQKQEISIEDVRKEAQSSARQTLLQDKIEEQLSKYSDEEAKVVRHYFDKLSAGETLDIRNIPKIMKEAERVAFEGERSDGKTANSAGGRAPNRTEKKPEGTLDDESAQGVADAMGIKIGTTNK